MGNQWWLIPLCFLTISTLATGEALAGNGKMNGTVNRSDGQAIPGAHIEIDGTALGAETDPEGKYFILNVPPGTFSARASAPGFTPKVIKGILVGADQILTVNFIMLTASGGPGEEVEYAERMAIDVSQTGARTRFLGKDFTSLPIGDTRELVSTSASTYKGFVRGSRIFECKTLVDGIDITDRYAGWVNDVAGGTTPYIAYNAVTPTQQARTSSLVDLSRLSIEEAGILPGGAGSAYSNGSAGAIAYHLKEGRGDWTARLEARIGVQGYKNLGPDAYADDSVYFRIHDYYAQSTMQADKDKAARFTYTRDKYAYGNTPEMLIDLATGGSIAGNLGLFVTGRYLDTHGFLPNEHTRKLNASMKVNVNLSPTARLNAILLLEDRGKLLGWKNSVYSDDFRYFLEGVPKWDGANIVAGLKWTHQLSPETFYEVQASIVSENSRRGFCDDNNDGIVQLGEEGDFLEWADTAQVHRYTARAPNTQWDKFFTTTARHETGSEIGISMSGSSTLKIARPSIYYENFTSNVFTLTADISSQVTANQRLGGGLQIRMHDVDMIRRADYIGGWFPQYKNYIEEQWNIKPKEFSLHVQDIMEYSGWVIDLGLRLDALDLAAGDLANYFAPFIDTKDASGGDIRVPVRGDNAPIKWLFSPHIGISHALGGDAALYFSFSHLQQPQPFSRLYANYNDFGNPALPVLVRTNQDPIRSTQFDVGVQWGFIDGCGLDINAYQKDIRSYGYTSLAVTPRTPWRLYYINTEFGYAECRGIEVTLRKSMAPGVGFLTVGGRVSYTYSHVKQALIVGSVNDFTFSTAGGDSARYGGQLPWGDISNWETVDRVVLGGSSTLTGGYDRPHRVTYNLTLRFPSEISLSSVGTFQSGFYYPVTLGNPLKRELRQSPMTKQIDVRIEKAFTVAGVGRLAAYVDLINAFDRENILAYNTSSVGQQAWERTGDPTGGPTINRPTARDAGGKDDGSMVYDVPRQIFVGVRLSF